VEEFLEKAKRAGKIRRVGFSYHGNKAEFPRVVDAYPWDFCQIQYNFLDEDFQAGTAGLVYAAGKGLGVIAMEPLRGGLLSGKAPDAVQAVWDKAPVKHSAAEWALRWVWDHPEVTTALSGMNDEAHIDENILAASAALPGAFTREELDRVEEARQVYKLKTKVGCTGCGYCMPCPSGVDIPACFKYYNDMFLFDDKSFKFKYAWSQIGLDGKGPAYASGCTHCGKCEKLCPQGLPIQRRLKEVSAAMEGFYLKPMAKMARWYFNRKRQNSPDKPSGK
jgi:predicted aldo/keto reductase-like oxidoreductase